MNGFYKKLSLALIFGLILSELDQIVFLFSPAKSIQPYNNLYLDKSYTTPITPVYYIYELTDNANKSIWAFVLCLVAAQLNYRFYLFACVFLFFRLSQVIFYIINRNCDFLNNCIVYVVMAVMIIIWAKPFHKEGKIIKM